MVCLVQLLLLYLLQTGLSDALETCCCCFGSNRSYLKPKEQYIPPPRPRLQQKRREKETTNSLTSNVEYYRGSQRPQLKWNNFRSIEDVSEEEICAWKEKMKAPVAFLRRSLEQPKPKVYEERPTMYLQSSKNQPTIHQDTSIEDKKSTKVYNDGANIYRDPFTGNPNTRPSVHRETATESRGRKSSQTRCPRLLSSDSSFRISLF